MNIPMYFVAYMVHEYVSIDHSTILAAMILKTSTLKKFQRFIPGMSIAIKYHIQVK